jgi:hypothetical protein
VSCRGGGSRWLVSISNVADFIFLFGRQRVSCDKADICLAAWERELSVVVRAGICTNCQKSVTDEVDYARAGKQRNGSSCYLISSGKV